MAQPIKINTGKYVKEGQVEIDGKIWSVKLPGAGTELRLSQAFRKSKLYGARINLLDKKIDSETITENELDQYEEYSKLFEENEKVIFEFFTSVFKDNTKDNSEVKKWVEETPTSIIQLAFEDIQGQANNEDKNETSNGEEKTSSEQS